MFKNTVFEVMNSAEFRIILLEVSLIYEHYLFCTYSSGLPSVSLLLGYMPLLSTETGLFMW